MVLGNQMWTFAKGQRFIVDRVVARTKSVRLSPQDRQEWAGYFYRADLGKLCSLDLHPNDPLGRQDGKKD